MDNTKSRPVYLNLLKIQMPVMAIVSIGHRLSGIFLTLSVPALIYLLDLSLRNPAGFHEVVALVSLPGVKILLACLVWVAAHHLFAGIRFLLIDIDIGVEKRAAQLSAWLVHLGAVICFGLIVGMLL